jgi:hypothetical protein
MPEERKLNREEKQELADARETFSLPDLDAFDEVLEALSMGGGDDELVFHVGVWLGDRVAAATGWVWVHLSLGPGLEAPALVSSDRGVALLPLQLVGAVVDSGDPHPPRELLDKLEQGARPRGAPGSYALVA